MLIRYGGISHQRDPGHRCALEELHAFSDLSGNVLIVLIHGAVQGRVEFAVGGGGGGICGEGAKESVILVY